MMSVNCMNAIDHLFLFMCVAEEKNEKTNKSMQNYFSLAFIVGQSVSVSE